ncbi:MAG: radical SAM protein [Planctomycetes bacterium]|nr:radical SAM protein [Planctomycetota bacterium]
MSELQTATVPGDSAYQYASPLFIAWQLNSECNLNCLHCCEEAGTSFPDQLNKDQMLNICRQFAEAEIPYVALSGGEPLLCPHFWDVCGFLRSRGIDVKIETNGEMIDPATAVRLARLKLRSVQISLDGASQKAHEALRERGDWRKVINACKLLRAQEGVNTEIVFVPTSFNIHEVGAAIDLAASLNAHGFYTGKLMRIGRAARNWEKLCPTDKQYQDFFEVLDKKKEQYKGRMKVYCYPYDVIEELRYRLTTPSASLLVLPNGKVKLIGPLPFICGDLRVMSLAEVWEKYKQSWRDPRVLEFGRSVVAQPALVAKANDWIEL